jgi:predicted metal-binding protein
MRATEHRPMPVTEVLICTTCRPAQASRAAPAAGQALLEAVQDAVRQSAHAGTGPAPLVRGIACLSGCTRACTIALQAPGKHTYMFGDLQADPVTAAQVLACAVLHQHSADGSLPRKERPERLRSGILAKLPPLADAPRLVA